MGTVVTPGQQDKALRALIECGSRTRAAIQAAIESGDRAAVVLAKANGIVALREALNQPGCSQTIMALCGTPEGFLTDRDGGSDSYSYEVIKGAVVVALMNGLELTNNEMDIIGGKCFMTVKGAEAKLRRSPWITHIEIRVGRPEDTTVEATEKQGREGGTYNSYSVYAMVPCQATALCNGRPIKVRCVNEDGIDTRQYVTAAGNDPAKVVDALKSKAKRRLMVELLEAAGWDLIDMLEGESGEKQARVEVRKPAPATALPAPDEQTESEPEVDAKLESFIESWRDTVDPQKQSEVAAFSALEQAVRVADRDTFETVEQQIAGSTKLHKPVKQRLHEFSVGIRGLHKWD